MNNGALSVDMHRTSTEPDRAPSSCSRVYLSFSHSRVHAYVCTCTYNTYICAHSLFLFVHTNSRYSPLQSSRPRLILLVRERGTEYLRDTETDSLQLYWPLPLLHLVPPPPSPSCRTAGWALRLTAAPTANQSAAYPLP